MISIEINNTLLFNLGIDIFSILFTIIIYISYKKNSTDTHTDILMRKLILFLLFALISDMFMWILDKNPGTIFTILAYIDNIIYYSMLILLVITWIKYTYFKLFNKSFTKKQENIILRIPFLIIFAIIISTPLTKFCFYIDENNTYHRGVLMIYIALIFLIYIIAISIISFIQSRNEIVPERKIELQCLSSFCIPIIVGGAIQTFVYGLSIQWPCTIIGVLIVILNNYSSSISKDPLTGMNNRRSLQKYLNTYNNEKPLSILLLDVNNFKKINDLYGHSVGDNVLICVSDILKMAFLSNSGFTARYGGDEFVVVLHNDNKVFIEKTINYVHNSFESFNKTSQLPISLSVSIGYGIAEINDNDRVAKCLKTADDNMYIKKDEYHKSQLK